MLQQFRLGRWRAKDVETRGAKQQGLHAGNFDTAIRPPLPELQVVGLGGIRWFGKILAWRNVNGVHLKALQQSGKRLVFGDVPGNVGDGQPHALVPTLAGNAFGSDWA